MLSKKNVLALLLFVFISAVAAHTHAARGEPTGVVNLNTASSEELQQLPGIGPSKAAAIIAHRERHPFRTIQELVRIKGLGRKTVRKLLPHLTVDGPTTITRGAAPARDEPTSRCACECPGEGSKVP